MPGTVVILAEGGDPWTSSSRRRLGTMDEDRMTLPMFAGVIDLRQQP
jgi:hypothetical protein